MTDHVLKALEEAYNPPATQDMASTNIADKMQRDSAKAIAMFLRTLIEDGPDERMAKGDAASENWLTGNILWGNGSGLVPADKFLNHLASRLEEIGEVTGCSVCGGSGQTQSIRHHEELTDCPSCNIPHNVRGND